MSDVDGVEVLAVRGPLHKELVVEVVAVVAHKHVYVPHYLQHVKTLCCHGDTIKSSRLQHGEYYDITVPLMVTVLLMRLWQSFSP